MLAELLGRVPDLPDREVLEAVAMIATWTALRAEAWCGAASNLVLHDGRMSLTPTKLLMPGSIASIIAQSCTTAFNGDVVSSASVLYFHNRLYERSGRRRAANRAPAARAERALSFGEL